MQISKSKYAAGCNKFRVNIKKGEGKNIVFKSKLLVRKPTKKAFNFAKQ